MAWTGDGYGEENEDEEQLDLETINDVLAVTREDQVGWIISSTRVIQKVLPLHS